MRRAHTTAVLVAALLGSGCSAILEAGDAALQTDAEDLRSDLIAEGFSGEDAECIISSMTEQGVDIDAELSAAGAQFEAFVEAVPGEWAAALQICVDPDAMADIVGDLDVEDMREGFIAGFVSTGGSEAEATCLFDELVARGVSTTELAGQFEPETTAIIPELMEICGVAPMDLTAMSDDEIRDTFITGFTATTPADRAQSECVFDGMVEAGVPIRDFAGDVITAQAEAALGPVLDECGVQF